ncbi:SusC/RagA family TonB-dependent receptor precursor [Tenacibaculum maritimum]|uniref:SusC/RagA family TonB-linked outer membrane protein n=1 Tax=Tenacibaculum maritimum TaxID=107401 RepID=UPI0012E480F3|nr:TonB-dependent receptor [Tenacibaculum maritimum]CAA0224617.1 SusC/RagA family TonB-dependent receptor precursor [Tenacibaculum maritimum]
MKKKSLHIMYMVFILLFTIPSSSFGQEKTITGTIISSDDKFPLPGASVMIKGTVRGTETDFDGNYAIKANKGDIISFSFIGYATQEVTVDTQNTINISLAPDSQNLDEVVVIGYGKSSKKLLSSSIGSVSAKELNNQSVTDVGSALQGKTAGVTIQTANGQPGAAPNIVIRGGSSINKGSSPLFIIDGIQRSAEDFNPDDVETMQVLKDAAAAAIYGARASNGVVLITTKSGKKGKVSIQINQRSSFSSLNKKLDYLNGADFLRLQRPGLLLSFLDENSAFGSGAQPTGTGNSITSNSSTRFLEVGESIPNGYQSIQDPISNRSLIFTSTNWEDELFRSASFRNTYISIDGANDKVGYYISIANANQEGVAIGTDYERTSLQSNLNFDVSEKLHINTTFNYITSKQHQPEESARFFGRTLRLAPTVRKFFDNGTIAPGTSEKSQTPLHFVMNNFGETKREKLNIGATLKYTILKGLTLTANASYVKNQAATENFIRSNVFNAARPAKYSSLETLRKQLEATLGYTKSFEGHNMSVLLGASSIDDENFLTAISGTGSGTDNISTINASSTVLDARTLRASSLLVGYFGRLSYDYDRKYILAATLRRDASSIFGKNNRTGYFPSVSGAWRIGEEDFLKDNNVISNLKLKASWGQTGNNEVGSSDDLNRFYLSQGIIDPSLQYNGQSAAVPTQIPNVDLGWETTTQTDIGFDLNLYESRLNFSFDYYRKVTTDLLFTTPLPNTSGFESVETNIGDVAFKGLEFSLTSTNFNTDNFSWTTNINATFSSNEVLKLPENNNAKNRIQGLTYQNQGANTSGNLQGIGGIAEGESLGNIIGWKFVKVYRTDAEAAADGIDDLVAADRTSNNGINYQKRVGGDVKWLDANNDGQIDFDDQVVLGNAIPDVTGGISNNFKYKGFELDVFLDFALGHEIFNYNRVRLNGQSQGGINGTSDLFNSWKNQGDITDTPRFVFFDFGNARNIHRPNDAGDGGGSGVIRRIGNSFHGANSQYVEDASYLSIRSIKLSYTLKEFEFLKKLNIDSFQLYASGRNLHYFTKYRGYNPEATPNGVDAGKYPTFKTFSIGANIKF